MFQCFMFLLGNERMFSGGVERDHWYEMGQEATEATTRGLQLNIQACKFIKKEILAQVFSCQFCEISKNNFFLQNTSGRLLL